MAISSPNRLSRPEVLASMRKALEDFLTFLAVEKGGSANTIAAYRNDLQQLADFIRSRPGTDGWESLDRAMIQDFVLDLKQRGYTESSVARKVAALRSFFSFLSAEGTVSVNPAEGLTSPRVGKSLPKAISPNEVDELLEQPARRSTPEARRDRAMLELLYATGMRVTELVSLDIGNLNLDPRSPYVKCVGKGAKERTMPIHDQAMEVLVDYLDEGRPSDRAGVLADPEGLRPVSQPQPRHHAAHAAPLLRHAHAAGRDAAAQRTGDARPRQHLHHAGLHTPDKRPRARGIRA